jgi:hypothetical protein
MIWCMVRGICLVILVHAFGTLLRHFIVVYLMVSWCMLIETC